MDPAYRAALDRNAAFAVDAIIAQARKFDGRDTADAIYELSLSLVAGRTTREQLAAVLAVLAVQAARRDPQPDPVVHRLRIEPAQRTEGGGYRAYCRCGEPFEAATMGAAHDLVIAHVRSETVTRTAVSADLVEALSRSDVAAALAEFRRIRHGKVGAGWEPEVTRAAWALAEVLDGAYPSQPGPPQ